jgi:AAHS family 4-hydroxybenzoate transporter-like MFS transporter
LPVGAFQRRVAVLCGAIIFMDGFDTQSINYVAPSLIRAWHAAPQEVGYVFGAGLVGLAVGALAGGPLADRLGRKPVILASLVLFGLFSLLTVTASSPTALLLLRLATGLGLGSALPNAVALTSEYSPQRRRATMVMAMFCGFSLGSMTAGFIAAGIIAAYGWAAIFWIGGALPLLLAAALTALLPESIRVLTLRGTNSPIVADILRRIDPTQSFPPATRFHAGEPDATGHAVGALFRAGRTATTLLLWVMFFMNLLDLYFLASWLPTVLSQTGATVATAIYATLPLQAGGIVGALVLSRLIDTRRPYLVQAAAYAIAALCIAGIGLAGASLGLAVIAIAAAGFCIVGGQIGANALAAMYYPTAIRSTGVGWALGIGRIGSIIGPTVGGVLLSWRLPTASLFFCAAVPALVAAAAALAMGLAGQGTSPVHHGLVGAESAE